MRILPALIWKLDGDPPEVLDERLLPLLEAIAASASLAAAVAHCGISYRAAWGLLRDYHRKLGVALVRLERGRGTSLTPAGERMLQAQRDANRRLARLLSTLAADIVAVPRHAASVKPLRLRVAASHDLALATLAERLAAGAGLELEIAIMGSLRALEEFTAGRADVAGFHVPIAGFAHTEHAPFLRWLRARAHRLIRFVDREQGLILPRGNPAHIRNLRDVAARGLRFVNRQKGSGTRLIVDQMLQDAGIDPRGVAGFRTEEFTHAAVAATVASGGADAGFGLRAAAAEYRLAFVPLVRERYFLACRARDAASPVITRLVETLRGREFGRIVRELPGYRGPLAGTLSGLGALEAGE